MSRSRLNTYSTYSCADSNRKLKDGIFDMDSRMFLIDCVDLISLLKFGMSDQNPVASRLMGYRFEPLDECLNLR